MGDIRIIGGQWKGRKIRVPEIDQLRPTGDRMRETLFNWLDQDLTGCRCLDLFAGSGVLGFEALSRNAASVTFVDRHRVAYQHLLANKAKLNPSQNVEILSMDAGDFLNSDKGCYDIVFVDPPFKQGEIKMWLNRLTSRLTTAGWVYLETEKGISLPKEWCIVKEKTTRYACGRLLKWNGTA